MTKPSIRVQSSVRLNDNSVPQPDVALLTFRSDFYDSGKPTAGDVLLLVEVADTTLAFDRDAKGPLYARSSIAQYWIVDLAGNQVLRYTDPVEGAYRSSSVARPGDVLVPRLIPSVSVPVSEVLGVD